MPIIHASYLLSDPQTGATLALKEAGFLTAIRTGATAALAACHLARRDSREVTCFGAGVHARYRYQLLCLCAAVLVARGRHGGHPEIQCGSGYL